jgi:hypothetical protein
MSRLNKILVGIFAGQLLLTSVIYFGGHSAAAQQTQTALLTTPAEQIDRITIDNGDGKQTVLSKVNGQWQLPDYHKLPASQDTVQQALSALAATRVGWPVATTASSQERFKVSDEHYQTRITLAQGDDVAAKIYLGTSPGFRQLHVRKEGQDAVYSVKLNSYDYPSNDKYWLDHGLLRPRGDVASLQGPDYTLSKQGADWHSGDGKTQVVKEQADKLLSAISSLSVQAAADDKPDQAAYHLKVQAAGTDYNYDFYNKGQDYFVSRNDYAQPFKISKADYEKITGLTATQLVKLEHPPGKSTTAGNTHEVPKQHKG